MGCLIASNSPPVASESFIRPVYTNWSIRKGEGFMLFKLAKENPKLLALQVQPWSYGSHNIQKLIFHSD